MHILDTECPDRYMSLRSTAGLSCTLFYVSWVQDRVRRGALECWVGLDRQVSCRLQMSSSSVEESSAPASPITSRRTDAATSSSSSANRLRAKDPPGKSMGGVRAQFSTPVSIQMSLYSIPFYASFEERLGYPVRLPPARLSVLRDQRKPDGLSAHKLRPAGKDGIEERPPDRGR